MKAYCTVLFLALLLNAIPVSAKPKYILISDSLAANADTLKVNKGAQWLNRIAKWRIGDYVVASSKYGGESGSMKGNLIKSKSESRSIENFSFVLTDKTADSATVNAAHNTIVNERHSTPLGNGIHLGSDEVAQESDSFTAIIVINKDTIESWTLFIGGTRGGDTEGTYEAYLSSGERKILLSAVTSNKDGGSSILGGAFGYEFIENGRSLGAVQYRGGAFGVTYMVWMHKGLDARMKILLASAMTAVLQLRT
jgi:hypothetical protein